MHACMHAIASRLSSEGGMCKVMFSKLDKILGRAQVIFARTPQSTVLHDRNKYNKR